MSDRKDDPKKMAEMEAWLKAVCQELGLDFDQLVTPNKTQLLRLIGTVAHGPSRPGAPLTAFLVGYAAASEGRDPNELARQLDAIAKEW